MRSRTEASNGFGVSDPLLLLTTMSVPRAFNPTCQLFSNPRAIPTNATTAAMPMRDAGERESGAKRAAQQATNDDGEESHDPLAAVAWSETIRPSIMCRILPARSRDSWVMRYEHHGAALFLLETNDEIEDRVGVFTVEVAGRFIRQEKGGFVGQAARNRDALAFAAR